MYYRDFRICEEINWHWKVGCWRKLRRHYIQMRRPKLIELELKTEVKVISTTQAQNCLQDCFVLTRELLLHGENFCMSRDMGDRKRMSNWWSRPSQHWHTTRSITRYIIDEAVSPSPVLIERGLVLYMCIIMFEQ